MPPSILKGSDPFKIRIATRESQLALWQANEVSRLLKANHPKCRSRNYRHDNRR